MVQMASGRINHVSLEQMFKPVNVIASGKHLRNCFQKADEQLPAGGDAEQAEMATREGRGQQECAQIGMRPSLHHSVESLTSSELYVKNG